MSSTPLSVLPSFLLVLVLSSGPVFGDARDKQFFVGVIEDAVLDREGHPHQTVVHVAFERQPREWVPVAVPPVRLDWRACSSGRELGSVASRTPEPPTGPGYLERAHQPVPGQRVPFVGKPSAEFAGWMGGEVRRPLVVTTGGCRDRDHWRPSSPPHEVMERLVSELRRVTKDIYDCDADGKQRPYDYPDSDVRTLESQVSDAGARLVTLSIRLPEDLAERCGLISGPGWESHTFVIQADGRIEHLGTSLRLLDAGDFDGDGHSELLFSVAGYDKGGYAIAWGGSFRLVRYEWSYH